MAIDYAYEFCLSPTARKEVGPSFKPLIDLPDGYPVFQMGDLVGWKEGLLRVAFRLHDVDDQGQPMFRVLLSSIGEDPHKAVLAWLKAENW